MSEPGSRPNPEPPNPDLGGAKPDVGGAKPDVGTDKPDVGGPNPDLGGGLGGESLTPPTQWQLPDLRVDREGDWYDDGVQITHPGILANLRGNLRHDAQGYFIQTRVRIPVTVDDTPFVIVRVERRDERLHAHLNDGTDEFVDPGRLRLGPGDVPYGIVKGGTFEARLSRAAAWQLLRLAEYDEASGAGTLRLGGAEWPLRRPS